MKTYNMLAILGVLSIMLCCKGEAPRQKFPATTVTIIFKDVPNQSSTDRFEGNMLAMPEASLIYVDSALNKCHYNPRSIGYDTITIAAPFGYAEIYHRNQVVENVRYLLMAGDTVLFTYGENLRPMIQSLRSNRNTWLYNLPYRDYRAIQPNGYSTQTVLNEFNYMLAYKAMNHPKRNLLAETLAKYKSYYIDLDSLRPIWQACRHDMMSRFDSLETVGVLPPVYADYYRQMVAYSKSDRVAPLPSDSLMHYIFHHNRALNYQYRVANKDDSAPQRFDLIAADTSLSLIVRNAILRDIMSLIENGGYWKPYPDDVIEHYRGRYRDITGDSTSFVTVSVNKENLLHEGYSSDLILEGLDGTQVAFENVLRKNTGKVIYVDLWASWCGPCRAGMPDAKKLREDYKGKDVVFLYLAINDTGQNWRNAVRSCETDYLGENYRILNAEDSRFLREIKHAKIPHMLLYDRTGKLVDTDAPRPENKQIKDKINSLLSS